jgi:hypothetical protein
VQQTHAKAAQAASSGSCSAGYLQTKLAENRAGQQTVCELSQLAETHCNRLSTNIMLIPEGLSTHNAFGSRIVQPASQAPVMCSLHTAKHTLPKQCR